MSDSDALPLEIEETDYTQDTDSEEPVARAATPSLEVAEAAAPVATGEPPRPAQRSPIPDAAQPAVADNPKQKTRKRGKRQNKDKQPQANGSACSGKQPAKEALAQAAPKRAKSVQPGSSTPAPARNSSDRQAILGDRPAPWAGYQRPAPHNDSHYKPPASDRYLSGSQDQRPPPDSRYQPRPPPPVTYTEQQYQAQVKVAESALISAAQATVLLQTKDQYIQHLEEEKRAWKRRFEESDSVRRELSIHTQRYSLQLDSARESIQQLEARVHRLQAEDLPSSSEALEEAIARGDPEHEPYCLS